MDPSVSMVAIHSLRGEVVVEVLFEDLGDELTILGLKRYIQEKVGTPVGLQRILLGGTIMEDTDLLEARDLTLVVDESPLATWDIAGNPESRLLSGSGAEVVYLPDDVHDYINVITQEPVRTGVHYFEFRMHKIHDEQWCGISPSKNRAGHAGESEIGWYYYCGRRCENSGALHAGRERRQVQSFEHVADGDIIGMLLDLDSGRLAFMRDGKMQGACLIPTQEPFYLSTTLDRGGDHVELRKVHVDESPIQLKELAGLVLEEYVIPDEN